MAENIRGKIRVKSMHIGDVITSKAGLASAQFATKLPFTLRDEAVEFREDEPDEDPLEVHELDAPIDVSFTGKGITLAGTFIAPTAEQLKSLMGGTVEGDKYHHSATKIEIEKAIKITCYDGKDIIIPHAKGYVLFAPSIGKDGKNKFPFKFSCLPASAAWDVDIVW